jgi:hypothetical protein
MGKLHVRGKCASMVSPPSNRHCKKIGREKTPSILHDTPFHSSSLFFKFPFLFTSLTPATEPRHTLRMQRGDLGRIAFLVLLPFDFHMPFGGQEIGDRAMLAVQVTFGPTIPIIRNGNIYNFVSHHRRMWGMPSSSI